MTTKKKIETTEAIECIKGEMVPLTPTENIAICHSYVDQVNLLAEKTPQKYIKKRVGRGNRVFDYVEINYVIAKLNAIFGFDWNFEIFTETVDRIEKQVVAKVRLTVRFADGRVVIKDAFGSSDLKVTKTGEFVDLGDDQKASASDGLKKAASLLGVAWDVYSGQAHASDEAVDTTEEDDFLASTNKQDPDKFRNITLQLANGKAVLVSKFEALGYFGKVKEALGDPAYYATLNLSGFEKSNEIPPEKIPLMYSVLVHAFKTMKKVEPKQEQA